MRFTRLGSIVEAGGESWPRRRLEVAVDARSAILAAVPIRRGGRVVLAQPATGSFFADLLAVWSVGACAVCVSPTITDHEMRTVVDFIEPAAVLVAPDGATPTPAEVPCVALAAERPRRAPTSRRDSTLDDDALILLTSGTTGKPKAVVHTFRALMARVGINRHVIGDTALGRTLCVLPVHFGHGLIGNSLTPLLAGHDLVVACERGPALLASVNRIIDEFRISFMSSVPSTWRLALMLCKEPPRHALTRVHVGSAPLPAALWHQIIEWCGTRDVVNAYGITETANWIGGASAAVYEPKDGLVGRIWDGCAALEQSDGKRTSEGEGELLIQTSGLMAGYYKRPDLSRQAIRDGWFHTGDLAHIDGDGAVSLVARLGSVINCGGVKVYPEELEQLLERHEAVREACAFAYSDVMLGERVAIAAALQPHARDTIDDLRGWLKARLADDKMPNRWYLVDDLPKTERGKLDRRAVAAMCGLGAHDRDTAARRAGAATSRYPLA